MSNHRTLLGLFLVSVMVLGIINPAHVLLQADEDNIERANGEEIGFSGQGFLLNKVNKNPSNNKTSKTVL